MSSVLLATLLAACSQNSGSHSTTSTSAGAQSGGGTGSGTGVSSGTSGTQPATRPLGPASAGPLVNVSQSCGGSNAEVVQAVDPANGYIYEEWIGCHGIGFARSIDGGRSFARPMVLPGSSCVHSFGGCSSWDPAISVAHDGTVYASFMTTGRGVDHNYPVVDASHDHGQSFPQVAKLIPAPPNSWGDRDYIAAGPNQTVYLTWDYGPSRNLVQLLCPRGGSCSFSAGDLNGAVQVSHDGGKTWTGIEKFTPGFPAGGYYGSPLLVEPNGRLDALEISHRGAPGSGYKLGLGYELFTSSADGGRTWAPTTRLGTADRTMSLTEWWIDGSLDADSAGNLYATWDTQGSGGDVGWISYSTDHGRTWSAMIRATPDNNDAAHIIEVAGGASGTAFVAWLTDAPAGGYAMYIRPFSITKGWLAPPSLVSTHYGSKAVWPGDTFGMSVAPGPKVLLSWGIGAGSNPKGLAQIYETAVSFG